MNRTVFYSQKRSGTTIEKKKSNIPIKTQLNKLQLDKLKKENKREEISDKFRECYVNIDSSFRNKIPKNILENQYINLSENSLNFTEGDNNLKIYIPNHKFKINDRIVIQNVESDSKYYNDALYFLNDSNFVILYWKDHGITSDYLKYYDIFEIEISDVVGTHGNYIHNLPANLLNSVYQVYLLNEDDTIGTFDQKYFLQENILSELNIADSDSFRKDYFFIQLPINFNSYENSNFKYIHMIKLSLKNIVGIPLNLINANFPINYTQLNGYQVITDVETDYIKITLDIKPFKTLLNYGNNKIMITKILSEIEGYPNTNQYKVYLKKTFYNIISIELLSSEISYLDYLVKGPGEINTNNKIYWQNIDDGEYVYHAEIEPGNYDPETFVEHLQEKMNTVETISSTSENRIFNLFNIELNTNTQKILFKSFKTEILVKPFNIEEIIINNQTRYKITIIHKNNSVQINDEIIISNAKSTLGISSTILNNTHIVNEINKKDNSYSILLPPLTLGTVRTDNKGGNSVNITTANVFRLLFNYLDTIGNLIGFKNVGNKDSITKYGTKISNLDNYYLEGNFSLNEVGDVKILKNYFNFTGKFFYFLMYVNNFESIISNGDIPNAFSKIQINGNPGDILFNSHISYPVFFDIPIPQLSELEIKFMYPDGNLVDFSNVDHSFTLKITELVSVPTNSQIDSGSINIYRDDNGDKPIEL